MEEDGRMNVYFDVKHSKMEKNTDIISLALVAEDRRTLYVEFMEYDFQECSRVMRMMMGETLGYHRLIDRNTVDHVRMVGSKQTLKKQIRGWLARYERVDMWGFHVPYKWVAFCDVFGGADRLPKNVSRIPFDVSMWMQAKGEEPEEYMYVLGEFQFDSLMGARTVKKYVEETVK